MRASRLSLIVVGMRAGRSITAGLAAEKLVVLVYPRCFRVVCPIQHLDERLQRRSCLQADPVCVLVTSERVQISDDFIPLIIHFLDQNKDGKGVTCRFLDLKS